MKSVRPGIVMLANAGHKPLDTRIFYKEALSLHRAGWNVCIAIPHSQSFEKEGIRIIAVPLPRKGWEQLVRCPWNILRKALWLPVSSVFHIHDSELLLVGIVLKLLGRKVIYDAHEDTPLQISYQHWIPGWAKGPYTIFYRCLEWLAGRMFKAVIVAEPVIAKYFPAKKVVLIRNFPIKSSFEQTGQNYQDRQNILVYVGLLSKARGVKEMLEGHRKASEKVKIQFVLGGKFAPQLLEQELLPKYTVDYRAWLPYDQMIAVLNSARIGIIVPHPIERYKTNYPVKLFEYMAAGLPVIASKEGESASFIAEANAGALVDPMSADAIAGAIVELLTNPAKANEMGERGRKLIFEKYNWEAEAEKLIELYEILIIN